MLTPVAGAGYGIVPSDFLWGMMSDAERMTAEEPISVSTAEARNRLGELIDHVVRSGERVMITRYGEPRAVLGPAEAAPAARSAPAATPAAGDYLPPALESIPAAPERLVTMKDVARQCGVTVATVSRAFNPSACHLVRRELRAKILAVAREIGYDPQQQMTARRLAARRGGQRVLNRSVLVCATFESMTDPYTHRMLGSLLEELTMQRFDVLFYRTTGPLPQSVLRGDVDGAIIMATHQAQELREALLATPAFGNRPIVTCIVPTDGCPAVLTDDQHAGYLLVDHLLRLGHRHLLYCYDHAVPPHSWRLQGYRQAYREHGLHADDYLYLFDWITLYSQPLVPFLRDHPQITGILAPNDPSAVHFYRQLTEAGYAVPGDYSLTGFDDTQAIPGPSGENILTTIRSPLESIGLATARLFLQQLFRETADDVLSVCLPTELIVRGSTGKPMP